MLKINIVHISSILFLNSITLIIIIDHEQNNSNNQLLFYYNKYFKR